MACHCVPFSLVLSTSFMVTRLDLLESKHSDMGLAWDLKVKTLDLLVTCTCDLLPPLLVTEVALWDHLCVFFKMTISANIHIIWVQSKSVYQWEYQHIMYSDLFYLTCTHFTVKITNSIDAIVLAKLKTTLGQKKTPWEIPHQSDFRKLCVKVLKAGGEKQNSMFIMTFTKINRDR